MAIQILPPQLANQIAAGEVVERPASVVKELVENSLDAGASRVDIDIDKGGSKLIRIRDNGAGIPRDELTLALARHATSKVQTLDDLEGILSFGFRGEALASISSVSRLTLTSRTADQSEAWQAHAEGSEVALKLMPAAHPVGTSIEVSDLFFNTPARRRFLKSDKTEFTHIDEWLKRIALVRSDVHFTLSHNDKIVRQFRPATTDSQYLQRLAQVAGRGFADSAVKVDCQHDGMHLGGYLQSPSLGESVDCNYFYVNGRLVRDRLVNHAVRQAFAQFASVEQPGYVLMFSLDPHQVDVNVHPAKHEVRFHQARYVHDFILQVLQSALSQIQALPIQSALQPPSQSTLQSELGTADKLVSSVDDDVLAVKGATTDVAFTLSSRSSDDAQRSGLAASLTHSGSGFADFDNKGVGSAAPGYTGAGQGSYGGARSGQGAGNSYSAGSSQGGRYVREELGGNLKGAAQLHSAAQSYAELLRTPQAARTQADTTYTGSITPMPPLLDGRYWVFCEGTELRLLALDEAARSVLTYDIKQSLPTGLVGQPLLMPVSVAADPDWAQILSERDTLLRRLGLELAIRYQQLIIKKVPPYLRDSQLASVIPEFLEWIKLEEPADEALSAWLAAHSPAFEAAPKLWQRIQLLASDVRDSILTGGRELPWQTWLNEHKH
ncbi:DNA mismatch repair endonuclease MutL [Shewanella sp. JM162201]|uniref:DNA mismatch repair protein MutL n=1 Tax=Shewanella jiangmenensis TaxID=2837387 RepID=A0ABS5V069_9GAMM|nr:DNA mismatch repair endonuclease MutL [Shewanella jiangmenensis]MBT1443845.1 DNA mismatch repair endonuclease MutL [Shewanella jiangmenensis]